MNTIDLVLQRVWVDSMSGEAFDDIHDAVKDDPENVAIAIATLCEEIEKLKQTIRVLEISANSGGDR